MAKKKAKAKHLTLSTEEFECAYKLVATRPTEEGISLLRNINGLLDQMEDKGDIIADAPEGTVDMYTTRGGKDVTLVLDKTDENTFKSSLTSGVKRFQAWVVRCVPDILDTVDAAEVVDMEVVDANEGEAAPKAKADKK
jgi:hypothetical protein|tara:strand:+ start:15210 stop:15626 length:417 start_codon:yes stop_codon:yes gene_type:complete